MDIFNSQWLLNMLDKSSKTPQGCILGLFDVLAESLQTPSLEIDSLNKVGKQALINFISLQAKRCHAENPEILAEHIVLIARNAMQQEMNVPGCNSLTHAKKAANALILAQTQRNWLYTKTLFSKPVTYAIAASVLVLTVSTAIWLIDFTQTNQLQLALTRNHISKTNTLIAANPKHINNNITASDAAAMYAKFEQMRNGTCQFPEAIQIPDRDKAIYLINVVGGKLPTDLHDLAVANAYLEKVRCNFTPMLMAHSK
jgi:hypothetical protein